MALSWTQLGRLGYCADRPSAQCRGRASCSGSLIGKRSASIRHGTSRASCREVVRDAVKGMLPQNKLRDRFMTKLKVYTGTEHPHQAQQPVTVGIEQLMVI